MSVETGILKVVASILKLELIGGLLITSCVKKEYINQICGRLNN